MEYQIIVKIPFEIMDDIAARHKAREIEEKIKSAIPSEDISVKLQECFKEKPPRGISL